MQNSSQNNLTRRRYNRLAYIYDYMEAPLEWLRFASWRERLPDRIDGERVLEVGVGTGKNLPYYPGHIEMTAIDLSPGMLARARKKLTKLNLTVDLREMDIQQLEFPDDYFDTVFATFVFCSVQDPIAGLEELRRVCKPDGRLILLEHMRPGNRFLGVIFDFINPIIVRMMGANINRRTVNNTRRAGWKVQVEENLASDVVRWIEAAS